MSNGICFLLDRNSCSWSLISLSLMHALSLSHSLHLSLYYFPSPVASLSHCSIKVPFKVGINFSLLLLAATTYVYVYIQWAYRANSASYIPVYVVRPLHKPKPGRYMIGTIELILKGRERSETAR